MNISSHTENSQNGHTITEHKAKPETEPFELDKEKCQLYDRNIRTWGKENQIR